MSIRRQFVLVLAIFAVTLTGVGGWVTWRLTSGALEHELDEKLRLAGGAAAAVGLDGSFVLNLEPGDPWLNAYSQRLWELRRYVADAYIFRRDGTLLVSTEDPKVMATGAKLRAIEPYPEELERAWTTGDATTPLFRGLDGRYYKYGFIRLQQSDAMLAVVMRAEFLEPLASFRRTILVGTMAAGLLAALIAAGLATTIVEPLESLSVVALRIQRGRLDEAVETERSDEIGRLARAMERMRQGIVARDDQLRLMLAQVAHEIRNPLGGVELFATAAAEAEDPEERRRLLDRVRAEIGGLNRIVDDFLSFARPMEPEPVVHDVRGPLEEAAELARREIEVRDGRLDVELPGEPLGARADPDHVKRLTLNLLRNAGQAGMRVRLRAERRDSEVLISVRDDGPGVPSDLRERIFEPFVSDKEQGAGLGLAIVRRLAEANGGRVELVELVEPVEAEGAGTGAEFRVYFAAASIPADATT